MPETSDSHLECGDLSPLCLSNTAFLSISLGEQQVFHFQFQVNSIVQTNIVSRAKLPEKESGDESPHSKGRLFRAETELVFANTRTQTDQRGKRRL